MKKSIFFLIVISLLSLTLISCGNANEQNAELPPTSQPSAIAETTADPQQISEEPEHGTSAYIDYLMSKAKATADTATNEELQEAVDWLRNNPHDYFSGLDNMEKTMYYGRLLECKYMNTGNQFEKAGWQAQKTVKYVYRGAESITDEATHNNLLKLQEMAAELPDVN